MPKISQEQLKKDREELRQLNLQQYQTLAKIDKYQRENKIFYWFPPPYGWKPDPNKTCHYHNPPQAKLIKAWANKQHEIYTFTGGNRSGKTTLSVAIAIASVLGYFPWDKNKTPINDIPCKVLMLGQKWEDHIAKTLVPKLWEWWPKNLPVKTRKNQYTDVVWTLENGSVIHIMSNRQEVDSFEGGDYDVFLPDEPPKEPNWDAIIRGLIDRGGRTLLTATMLKEPWAHQKIIKARNEDGTPDRTVYNVHTTMEENVGYGLTQKFVERYKWRYRNNPKVLQARVAGIPSYMQGLVINRFNREIHLKRRFDIPTDWLIDIEIDVHPREQQAVLFIATNPRNERYLCDEIWMHGDGTAVGHAIVRRIIQRAYRRVNYIEIDPLAKSDSNNDDTTRGKIDKVLREFALNNRWFNPRPVGIATKDKDSGILAINEHLLGPNNEPSIWMFDDLVVTPFEVEGWMYDQETQKPQDKDDHFPECWYRAMLLNTRWYEPEESEDEDYVRPRATGNIHTGY
jgi:hypothetical protein